MCRNYLALPSVAILLLLPGISGYPSDMRCNRDYSASNVKAMGVAPQTLDRVEMTVDNSQTSVLVRLKTGVTWSSLGLKKGAIV